MLVLERAEAMCPENIAAHFARIKALAAKYKVMQPCHILNLDECRISIRRMNLGRRVKWVVQRRSRANARTLKWSGVVDHVTMMVVLNGAGQVYTPAFVLSEKVSTL